MENQIKEVMSEILKINIIQIKDESSPLTVSTWDSMKHIELILGFEKQFKIRFEDAEIPSMINYPIIVATIQSHLDQKNEQISNNN